MVSKGIISKNEARGKLAADSMMVLVGMRGGRAGAQLSAVYFISDYAFTKNDVSGWIRASRATMNAVDNGRNSIGNAYQGAKSLRREYNSNPRGFLHKVLNIPHIDF
ncbi:hypothetical protein [Shewanella japonica]|uniref:hypothetical protein n=1 Tax=Shewanella japonica TaxID=93973 RepID=UPI000E757F88|nr:hypothetical protein [Shewanella japonica]